MILSAFDTNVLLYAADRRGDERKHLLARDLLDKASALRWGMLPLQALTEFYAVAVRKLGAAPDAAAGFLEAWSDVFPVYPAGLPDVADAIRVHRDHGLQFWDGMMWAVARRAGATVLFSEDLQDGRELEGVRFLNPFEPRNAERVRELMG